jgi:plasmid stability protein
MISEMHRTQINLEEWQVEALRVRARAAGCSMGALIRQLVTEYLAPDLEERRRLLDALVIDVEDDGLPHDAAINHDHYLYGAPKVWDPDAEEA